MSILGINELDFLRTELGCFGIVLVRSLGLVMTAPNWGVAGVSTKVRLVLALGLAATLAPNISIPANPEGLPGWASLLAIELAIGTAMGLSAALVISGARQAGELVALHAGLAPASLFEIHPDKGLGPVELGEGTDSVLTPLGHLHGLIAIAVFVSLDGPLILVRALARSFISVPPGHTLNTSSGQITFSSLELLRDAFSRAGTTLGLALQAAAPAGVALLLSGLVLAWLSRSGAGRPLSGLDWPARVGLGLVVSAVSVGTLATTLAAAWNAWATSIGGH